MDNEALKKLSPGAQALVRRALQLATAGGADVPGVNHWLAALLERHGPMAQRLAGVDPTAERRRVDNLLSQGDFGVELSADDLVSRAADRAAGRGAPHGTETDVAATILVAASLNVEPTPGGSPGAGAPCAEPGSGVAPATPTIDKFGRDLTREAAEARLLPVVGRDEETSLVIETLCRRTKRNPALVGPAGVGKTAIVEGLAQRIAAGDVPEPLRDCRVLALQPTSLVSGAGIAGQFEKRLETVLDEARQPGVILFIDEVHSLIGAGGRTGTGDAASLLKPALARGDMACIAATTDEEYRKWIEPDRALERRFQPVRVQEITVAQARVVLLSVRDDLQRLRHVTVDDEVLEWILQASMRFFKNRYLPDKSIDLLEQTIARAVTRGLSRADIAVAREVAERMTGMPVEQAPLLSELQTKIADAGLLTAEDADVVVDRLQVTTRGLDIRPMRPNAVLLLMDAARGTGADLARLLAAELFGSPGRVIHIDLGQMPHAEDINRLLGSSAGYVGYGDTLPIHALIQTPWAVLRLDRIDACHPCVRDAVARAIEEGFFTDAQGRRIHVSDAIVLLTAQAEVASEVHIGFNAKPVGAHDDARKTAEEVLGAELVDQCDVVCFERGSAAGGAGRQGARGIVTVLSERYREHGLEIVWEDSFIDWLSQATTRACNERECERLLDDELAPKLREHIPRGPASVTRRLRVCCGEDGICVSEG